MFRLALSFLALGLVALAVPFPTSANEERTRVDTRIFLGNKPAPCYEASVPNCGQTVPVHSVVHDKARVSSYGPPPTGTVTFAFFNDLDCRGNPVLIEVVPVQLTNSPTVSIANSSSNGPLEPGDYSYRALYNPDAAAQASGLGDVPGDCEQLRVK